jgi:hypothetical protein
MSAMSQWGTIDPHMSNPLLLPPLPDDMLGDILKNV